jgi:hypothetical protein
VVLHGEAAGAPDVSSPPPTLAAWLYGAGSAVGAVLLGWAGAVPAPRGAAGVARRALDGLRALHSGRAGDYVTWTTAGAAGLSAAFLLLLR